VSATEDPLTPAEAEAARLLGGLREAQPEAGADLVASVARSARWQRSVRHALVSAGTVLGSIAGGLGVLARRRS
jgi:hypothetical protein